MLMREPSSEGTQVPLNGAKRRKVEDREAVFVPVPLPALRAGKFPEHLQ